MVKLILECCQFFNKANVTLMVNQVSYIITPLKIYNISKTCMPYCMTCSENMERQKNSVIVNEFCNNTTAESKNTSMTHFSCKRHLMSESLPFISPANMHTSPFSKCHMFKSGTKQIEVGRLVEVCAEKPQRNESKYIQSIFHHLNEQERYYYDLFFRPKKARKVIHSNPHIVKTSFTYARASNFGILLFCHEE